MSINREPEGDDDVFSYQGVEDHVPLNYVLQATLAYIEEHGRERWSQISYEQRTLYLAEHLDLDCWRAYTRQERDLYEGKDMRDYDEQ